MPSICKVAWDMKDMTFDDAGTTRTPLMIWDIAINSKGIVYFSTYVQVRLVTASSLKKCLGIVKLWYTIGFLHFQEVHSR